MPLDMQLNTKAATGRVELDRLHFLVLQVPRIITARTIDTSFIAGAVLPPGSKPIPLAMSHTTLLGRDLAGLRHLLAYGPTPVTELTDKGHTWPGYTVVPFEASASIPVDETHPFGNAVPEDSLQTLTDMVGQVVSRAWVTDVVGLLSICYFGSANFRRVGTMLLAYLQGNSHVADIDSGLQIEAIPSARPQLRLYFHTAATWKLAHARSFATASQRRRQYSLWRYQAMKAALLLYSLYQIPFEVVRVSPTGSAPKLLRTITEPWAVDQRPCSIPIDRAKEFRVVAHVFGSELTLFHYAYLVDHSGVEHFYAAYYVLLQGSENSMLQHLASFAAQHDLVFTTASEDTDEPFA